MAWQSTVAAGADAVPLWWTPFACLGTSSLMCEAFACDGARACSPPSRPELTLRPLWWTTSVWPDESLVGWTTHPR